MKRNIEILAPAGSYEGMRAAMNAGCDAVYIGGTSFGARAYANNLDTKALLQAIDEAHIRGKHLYLTVNTLVKERERDKYLYAFLEPLYLQGLDAVIVQDFGVMHFIHRNFPELPIHASTQTTLMMAQGANLLREMGVTRMVTARELSLSEIKNIRENTNLEIETFVHGALCYCYSGQCLMSSMIGGRSGNRGRCAQPCRMPYQFVSNSKQVNLGKERYLLSPKDINTLCLIPELVDAGIDSFKIEGRMKRPEYAAAVSYIYRKYVDLYQEIGKQEFKHYVREDSKDFQKDMTKLQDIYNRGGFSQGYFHTHHGRKMMSMQRPNHSGVYIGEVTQVKGKQVAITLKEKVNAQDVLEINTGNEKGYEFTVKDPHAKGDVLRTFVGNGQVKDKKNQGSMFQIGSRVYRTKNNELLNQLTEDYINQDKKLEVKAVLRAMLGERLTLTLTYGDRKIMVHHELVQEALKQPMTEEKLISQVSKTGDTNFRFEDVVVEMDDNIFVPVGWLNEIRREALAALEDEVTSQYRRKVLKEKDTMLFFNKKEEKEEKEDKETVEISVSVQTVEQLGEALIHKEITAIYLDYDTFSMNKLPELIENTNSQEKEVYLLLPHICRDTMYQRLKKDILSLADKKLNGFVIKNMEELALLKELSDLLPNIKIILNHNMYIFNQEAKVFYQSLGIEEFTAPLELNYQELRELGIQDFELQIYGYLPLMVSAQCVFDSTDGCCKEKTGNQRNHYLVDRMQKRFFVQTNCNGCYNTIYNGQCLVLTKQVKEIQKLKPKRLRMDFTIESKEEMKYALEANIGVFCYGEEKALEMDNITTGHFKRGVE